MGESLSEGGGLISSFFVVVQREGDTGFGRKGFAEVARERRGDWFRSGRGRVRGREGGKNVVPVYTQKLPLKNLLESFLLTPGEKKEVV